MLENVVLWKWMVLAALPCSRRLCLSSSSIANETFSQMRKELTVTKGDVGWCRGMFLGKWWVNSKCNQESGGSKQHLPWITSMCLLSPPQHLRRKWEHSGELTRCFIWQISLGFPGACLCTCFEKWQCCFTCFCRFTLWWASMAFNFYEVFLQSECAQQPTVTGFQWGK